MCSCCRLDWLCCEPCIAKVLGSQSCSLQQGQRGCSLCHMGLSAWTGLHVAGRLHVGCCVGPCCEHCLMTALNLTALNLIIKQQRRLAMYFIPVVCKAQHSHLRVALQQQLTYKGCSQFSQQSQEEVSLFPRVHTSTEISMSAPAVPAKVQQAMAHI